MGWIHDALEEVWKQMELLTALAALMTVGTVLVVLAGVLVGSRAERRFAPPEEYPASPAPSEPGRPMPESVLRTSPSVGPLLTAPARETLGVCTSCHGVFQGRTSGPCPDCTGELAAPRLAPGITTSARAAGGSAFARHVL